MIFLIMMKIIIQNAFIIYLLFRRIVTCILRHYTGPQHIESGYLQL